MTARNTIFLLSLILLLFIFLQSISVHPNNVTQQITNNIRFVPIGDSYTIGEGVPSDATWPLRLTRHLKREGVAIEVVANPSRTGWTTADAINRELPVFEQSSPNFATLLIGVNDWVQGVDAETFRSNLRTLMDRMIAKLPSPERLVILTIPDFSATPTGRGYGGGRDISAGISAFNNIIADEAKQRSLAVVDLFALSQAMNNDPTLIAPDGLHPSGKEYARWEEVIYPVAKAAVTKLQNK